MNYSFGSGKLITRAYNPDGSLGSPVELAVLQECNVEFKVATKKLMGPYRFAVATADGDGDIPFSAKSAAFNASAFNLAFQGTVSAGGQSAVLDEVGTIAAGTYTLAQATSYIPGSAVVWLTPPGGISRQLRYLGTAGAPVAGQSYTDAAAGTLTFATGDNGGIVRVTYRTNVTSGGQTITIANPLQNSSLGVRCSLIEQSVNRQNNKPATFILDLNSCIVPSLKLGFKMGDWTVPDFTMDVQADQNNQIGTAYFVNWDNN